MDTKAIMRRIEALEAKGPNPLIAECTKLETGEVKTMPIRDAIPHFEDWQLDKIVGGNNLHDLDAYFAAFRNYVDRGEHSGKY